MRSFLTASLLSTAAAAAVLQGRASPASATDFNELHAAALLSSAAYTDCQGQAFGVQIASQINNVFTDTQGFIGYNPSNNRILTVFRGSTDPSDLFNDADIVPVTPSLSGVSFPSGVQVMLGVMSTYGSVHTQVISTIKSLLAQHPTATIEVTGHSLGGAITYLAHVAIAQNFPHAQVTSNALAAFAIGNAAFANFAGGLPNAMLRRGNNLNDGVPNLYPLFTHYGTEFYGSGTAASELKCVGEKDSQCSAGNGRWGVTTGHFSNSGVFMTLAGCG